MTSQPPHYGQQPPTPGQQYGQPYPQQPAYGQPVSGQPYGTPPPQYGQQPSYPAQQPPKKKRKWPWVVGGIVLAGILGCVGLFTLVLGGTGKALNELDENQKGKNAAAGHIGKATTDGKFSFTVTGMKCGATKVGSEFANATAQGQFCQVSVTVKNTGTTAEIFDGTSQKAYDAKGTEYSYDGTASTYANEKDVTFLQQINPGNQVNGILVFDVPKGTKLTAVVLHESFYTAGVRVPMK